MSELLTVHFKAITSEDLKLENIDPETTISDLKAKLCQEYNQHFFDPSKIDLIYEMKPIENDKKLSDIGYLEGKYIVATPSKVFIFGIDTPSPPFAPKADQSNMGSFVGKLIELTKAGYDEQRAEKALEFTAWKGEYDKSYAKFLLDNGYFKDDRDVFSENDKKSYDNFDDNQKESVHAYLKKNKKPHEAIQLVKNRK